jgi:flagellar FliL protein
MAEETESVEAPSGGGGASWMIVILVMVLALAAGAGGAYFLLSSQTSGAEEPTEEEEVVQLDPGAEFQSRLVALEPFVVNVAGDGYPRFLKLKIELEATSTDAKTELEMRVPQVRDTTILLLASKRMPEVTEFEGRALLKDDLRDRINDILGSGAVASVLFTEFVVQ